MPGSMYTVALVTSMPPGYNPGKILYVMPFMVGLLNEQTAGVAAVAAPGPPPGHPLGMGPPSSGTTEVGSAGIAGEARFLNGSPDTSTPVGAVVHRLSAPPCSTIRPTTSHSGAVNTPLPDKNSAPGFVEQLESIWTVPLVETMLPTSPVILLSPQPSLRARSEYGSGISLSFVATPKAPVRCCVIPTTPMKNDGLVFPIVTSIWPGKPAFV